MRIGMTLNYTGGFKQTVAELADFEKAGLDMVFVAEAYSFDAVSQLGYIAAKTERMQIASGILPDLLAHPDAARDDRGRARLRLRRPVRARHRRLRARR